MVKIEPIYIKQIFTGFSFLMVITLVLSLLSYLKFSNSSEKTGVISIEFIPEPVIDSDYPVYRLQSSHYSQERLTATLFLESKGTQKYGPNISPLTFEAVYVDKDIIRICIRDSYKKMWAVDDFNFTSKYSNNNYEFSIVSYPFSFEVIRKSNNQVIFSTAGMGFYFSERYLEIGTFAKENRKNMGLYSGQSNSEVWLKEKNYVLWPSRLSPGHHPFYLEIFNQTYHGVFLHNFNAMEVQVEKNCMKFRTTGGVVDLFVILGETPENVIKNYHKIIGFPKLPPYWALGYNIGKKSYEDSGEVLSFLNKFIENSIPFDGVLISDNYIEPNMSFTLNQQCSGLNEIKQFLNDNNKKLVIEIQSGITTNSSVFSSISEVLLPVISESKYGKSGYIDWYNPKSASHWFKVLSDFKSLLDFDGLYLSSNEINTKEYPDTDSILLKFTPDHIILDSETIPISTKHFNSYMEIDLHSLWGPDQAKITDSFLQQYGRSFIISESSRAGSQGFHIFTENHANWDSFRETLVSVINYEMFGTHSGPSICGYFGIAKGELCERWHQLAVFYPFLMNFNQLAHKDSGYDAIILNNIRTAILTRYSLSLYAYYLYFEASLHGGTILRPMFFEFSDPVLLNYPQQLMLGSSLFGIFSFYDRSSTISVYFPESRWYDLQSNSLEETKGVKIFNASNNFRILIRSGHIIPWQNADGAGSLGDMRKRPLQLIIALDANYVAKGEFFTDDGVSLDSFSSKKFSKIIVYTERKDKLMIYIKSLVNGYTANFDKIESIKVFGCKLPAAIRNGNKNLEFTYLNEVLVIYTDINTYQFTAISIFLSNK